MSKKDKNPTTPPTHRKCKVCGETKLLSEFCNHKSNRFGKTYQCKSCRSIESKEWFKKNPDYSKLWYEGRKEQHKKQVAALNKARKERKKLQSQE